jgi:hypothetical protein
MATNNNIQNEETREENESAFDFWSDEGARRFNEILDEGRVYLSAEHHGFADSVMDSEDLQGEYCAPELYDRNDETLPPGEMELIFENSYIM